MATSKVNFTVTRVIAVQSFTISNVNFPVYSGGFSNEKVWDSFVNEHHITTEIQMMSMILDVTRCHFGPNSKNWPGMTIRVGFADGTSVDVDLPPGKTSCKPFKRGPGTVWNWTMVSLATASVFEQVYRQSDQIDTSNINGNWNGANQLMTSVRGFTGTHYTNCQTALSAWLTSVGQKARDPAIQSKISAAAVKAIADRKDETCSWNIPNIARYLHGDPVDLTGTNITDFLPTQQTVTTTAAVAAATTTGATVPP